jgi:hypothetical protein
MKNILKLNEYNNYTSLSEDELLEMANITDTKTGIKNVVLWVGPNPKFHGHRIKVSNTPNSFKPDNCFTITIPNYNIIGNVNTKFITSEVFNDIIKFIELNIDLICKYSEYETSTEYLLDNIKSI